MLAVLSERPVQRLFEYNGDFDFAHMPRYHQAAENYSKGVINNPACDSCLQGVAPESGSLRMSSSPVDF